MQPINTICPFPAPATCFLVPGALDGAECAGVVEAATRRGFEAMGVDYPPSYRDNDRMVLTSPELASTLFERLRAVLPEEIVDDEGGRHRLVGLNERFRLCRYRGGQSFRIHQDGAHAPSDGVRSRLTVQVYLDEGFRGGRTRFYRTRRGGELGAIVPEIGTVAVFDHALWHDGEPVTQGTKHVMRTDVLYRRVDAPARTSERNVLRGHEGYVFVVRSLSDGSLASGSRDRTIRTWTRGEGDAWSCTRVFRGHEASVSSLVELRDGTLVSGSRDRTVRTWDRHDERGPSRVIATLGGAVLSLERLDDGTIACGAADGRITIMARSGAVVRELAGHGGWVWSLACVGPDRLLSASDDGTVRLWIPSRGECIGAAAPGRGPAHALASLEGGAVAAAFADGHVVVYEASSRGLAPIAVHRAGDGEIHALHALAGGGFASGGEDACARIHRGPASALDAAEVVRCEGFVRSIAQVPGTNRLAVAGYDGCIRLS